MRGDGTKNVSFAGEAVESSARLDYWNWPISEYPIQGDWESGAYIARFSSVSAMSLSARSEMVSEVISLPLPLEPDLEVKGRVARYVPPQYLPLQNAVRVR